MVVASVYVAPQFELEPDAQPSTNLLSGMTNSTGYNGQGMVIAIIDSGMAVAHPAFQGELIAPTLTREAVESILNTKELKAETLVYNLTADQVYHSAKVPFMFDYADKDTDVYPTYDDHGTHVSGIAAGMNAEAAGVASQAQILAMKTFSSYGTAGWDAILAALDDAVALGADVINMSLGMASGFSSPESDQAIYDALEKVSNAGILISAAAGNEYNSAYGGKVGRDRPLTVNPDYGSMDSPASLTSTMAVASVEKEGTVQSSYFTLSDSRVVAFWDTAETGSAPSGALQFKGLGEQAIPYVPIPDHGAAESYADLDLTGKIALVERGGGVTYDEMKNAAKAANAAGLLVYNNVPGMLYMGFTTYDLPAAFISQVDGEHLANLTEEQRSLTISMESGEVTSPTSGQMSDFSAWGVTPELKLKPDITAPGGNIKSAVGNDKYALKSGTSMAAPFIAGSMAVVKQYLDQTYPDQSSAELANALLMSTAELVESRHVPYSPRKQGAGNVNVDYAIHSPAYLTVPGMDRPKIELGDDVGEKGVYELTFQVHNLTNTEQTYTLGGTVQTDAVEPTIYQGRSILQSTGLPYLLEAEIAPQTITVPQKGTTTVNTSITLTEKDRTYLTTNFPNGGYVEGFVTLTAQDSTEIPRLSLPYLAFFGDWTKAAVIDRGYHWDVLEGKVDNASQYSNTAAVLSKKPGSSDSITTLLGDNPYHKNVPYLADRNAISPNGDHTMDQLDRVLTGLLRSVKSLTYTITEEGNPQNVYYTKTVNWKGKSVYSSSNNEITPAGSDYASQMEPWAGTNGNGEPLPNNSKAQVTVTCEMPYTDHAVNNENLSWSFPTTVDTEAPTVETAVETEGQTFKVKLTVKDNQYISNILLTNANGKETIVSEPMAEPTAGVSKTLTYDVSGYGEKLKLVVNDYAGNRYESTIKVPGNPDEHKIVAPTTPLDESFGENEFPLGWEVMSKTERISPYTWNMSKQINAGRKLPYCNGDPKGSPQNEWLITRPVNLAAEKGVANLTFEVYTTYAYAVRDKVHNLTVKATMDGGDTWEDLWNINDWSKGDWYPAKFAYAEVAIPQKFQNAAELRLAFVYEGNGSYVYLDHVKMNLTEPEPEIPGSHRIEASAGVGGSINPSGSVFVKAGESQSFTITTDQGYEMVELLVDGTAQEIADTYTFTNVQSAHTISVSFREKQDETAVLLEENFDSLVSFPEGWSVEGPGKDAAAGGTWKIGSFWGLKGSGKVALCDSSFTNTAARKEKLILPALDLNGGATLTFDAGVSATAVLDDTAKLTVQASLDGTDWEIIWDAADYLPKPSNAYDDIIGKGSVIIPQKYQTANVQLAFVFETPANTYFQGAIDHVKLVSNAEPEPSRTYTIEASAGVGGTISPSGSIRVKEGTEKTFGITADAGYAIEDVLMDGVSVGVLNSYTFKNIQDDHTLSVSFRKMPPQGPILIEENFNSISTFPEGWTVEGPSKDAGSSTWKIGGFPGMPGSVKTALCDSSFMDPHARAEKLLLPVVDLPNGGELTFDAGISYGATLGGDTRLTVQASLNGTDWEVIWDAAEQLDPPASQLDDIIGHGAIQIPEKYHTADVRLAFVFECPVDGYFQGVIDNVLLRGGLEPETPVTYHVTFDANGGQFQEGTTVTIEAGKDGTLALNAIPDPTRSKYDFTGWYTAAEGGTQITSTTVFSEDSTVYAHWNLIETPDSGSSGGNHRPGNSVVDKGTVKNPDGSTTEIVKQPDGSVIKETSKVDGSHVVEMIMKDGSTSVTETSLSGRTETQVKLPEKVTTEAAKSGQSVALPMPSVSVQNGDGRPSMVSVDVGNAKNVKISIPVERSTAGVVAVVVNSDGTREVVRKSIVTENGVVLFVDGKTTFEIEDRSKAFVDTKGHWASDAIAFVSSHEIFNGVSEISFAPDMGMTRGMLAVVLHNLESNPVSDVSNDFTDVAEGTWYEKAIQWAVQRGIVNGYGNGLFGADDQITREQLAVMLYRYSGSPATPDVHLDFADANEVSSYAESALRWAVSKGMEVNNMQEMDNVRVTVEKETYSRDGVHKGMYGWICYSKCVKGYWLVNFPQCGEKDDIAEISIKEEDLEVVRILDARVNEQIKAQFEKEADQTKSFAEIPDDLSNYRI